MRKLFFSPILISASIAAQQDKMVDSLLNVLGNQTDGIEKVNTLASLHNSFLYQEAKVAKQYAEKELELSQKINYEKGIATDLYHLSVYYNNIDEVECFASNNTGGVILI